MELKEWNARLHGLVIFRGLLTDPVMEKLVALVDTAARPDGTAAALAGAAGEFEAALFETTPNWSEYLSAAVLESENICVRRWAHGQHPAVLEGALKSELGFLQQLGGLTLEDLLSALPEAERAALAFLPRWETAETDLAAAYLKRLDQVGR